MAGAMNFVTQKVGCGRMTANTDLRAIEYVPLDEVSDAVRNPKGHDVAGIQASIARFGLVAPSVIDERTGRLVAGHGRLAALRAMRDAGQSAPAGVRTDASGAWSVPMLTGWSSRSDAEADAYLIADNEWTVRGAWDEIELAELLQDVMEADPDLLAVTGYAESDIIGLLGGPAGADRIAGDPDDAPSVPQRPVTAPGDVWHLGEHRLLCGDATDSAAVAALLSGERCDAMWTDPPYGVEYVGKTRDALTIRNDDAPGLADLLAAAFAAATSALRPGAAVYVAHPPGALRRVFLDAFCGAGWMFRQELVWVKDSLVLGRSDYHYRHEPIMYGFTDGGAGRLGRGGKFWRGDDAQTSVFEVPKPSRSETHPTMKPTALITAMLANSCPSGGLVLDPFGGSGSTLIAAHMIGVRARLVEIDPAYCDVICRRYQEATGDKPVCEATGEAHDFSADALPE